MKQIHCSLCGRALSDDLDVYGWPRHVCRDCYFDPPVDNDERRKKTDVRYGGFPEWSVSITPSSPSGGLEAS